MIDNQTIEQLRSLRLDGMLAALNDPATAIATSELSFEQRLSLLAPGGPARGGRQPGMIKWN